VRHAGERQQVVLADRLDRQAAGEHQAVVALVVGEGREVERAWRQHLGPRPRHPPGAGRHARRLQRDAERGEEVGRGGFGGREVRGADVRHDPERRTSDRFGVLGRSLCRLAVPPHER
jgi:hypothetical protein